MKVKIRPEWQDEPDNTVYIVVEDNGERLLIREDREPRFPNELIGTELVRRHMILTHKE